MDKDKKQIKINRAIAVVKRVGYKYCSCSDETIKKAVCKKLYVDII